MKEIPADLRRLVRHVENHESEFETCGGSKIYDMALSKGWVQKGDVVYDLGCGDGSHLPKISHAVVDGRIYAIDIAPSLVSAAMKIASMLGNVEVYQMDARNLEPPLEYNAADKVFVSEVLGTVPNQSAYKILNESLSAAKPKGKIIATMDSKEFFVELGKALGAPVKFMNSLEKGQPEYYPGLFGSLFSEEDINKSPLGEKCSLEICRLSHDFLDPTNMLFAPPQFRRMTEKYLVLATKK